MHTGRHNQIMMTGWNHSVGINLVQSRISRGSIDRIGPTFSRGWAHRARISPIVGDDCSKLGETANLRGPAGIGSSCRATILICCRPEFGYAEG